MSKRFSNDMEICPNQSIENFKQTLFMQMLEKVDLSCFVYPEMNKNIKASVKPFSLINIIDNSPEVTFKNSVISSNCQLDWIISESEVTFLDPNSDINHLRIEGNSIVKIANKDNTMTIFDRSCFVKLPIVIEEDCAEYLGENPEIRENET